MKTIVFALAAAISTGCASAQTRPSPAPEAKPASSQLPPGMKQYWFVMLKRGPKRDQPADVAKQLQAGHMANIEAYAKSGQLQIAGPFADEGDWRGIFILDVADRTAAEKMCKDDPAVAAGRLECEIHPWLSQTGATLK
ncbi:MAG: YciI family protein [Pseudomonadota bacterium]|nr:YciI family protein [Pseudomonadota bacterium]